MTPQDYRDLNPPQRTLLGPGPSMVHPRVLAAMSMPMIGHMDPYFLQVMDEVQELLRMVFQTENELTIPVSGTGTAGMETALCNFIVPGDNVLIAINGFFGERFFEIASRYGANVDRLEHTWGDVFDPDEIEKALRVKKYSLLAIVHAETSTGARQPEIQAICEHAHKNGAIVILDTVASLGGDPIEVDAWDVDVAYSGSQKCISCPPGLAPITVSERARERLKARKEPVHNWYFDLSLVEKYWGTERKYHHTAPVSMNYALREALRLIAEEGLQARFERHQKTAQFLWDGLETLDIPPMISVKDRLPVLTTMQIPPGVNDLKVRKQLLADYNIEIAGGLGPLAGKIWRIGLMGHSCRRENVMLLLSALRLILSR